MRSSGLSLTLFLQAVSAWCSFFCLRIGGEPLLLTSLWPMDKILTFYAGVAEW